MKIIKKFAQEKITGIVTFSLSKLKELNESLKNLQKKIKAREREILLKKVIKSTRGKAKWENTIRRITSNTTVPQTKNQKGKIPCLVVKLGIRSREEICGIPYLKTNHFSFNGTLIKTNPISRHQLLEAAEKSLNSLNDPELALCIIEEVKRITSDEETLECFSLAFQKVIQKHLTGGFPHCKEEPSQNAHMNIFFDELKSQEFVKKRLHSHI